VTYATLGCAFVGHSIVLLTFTGLRYVQFSGNGRKSSFTPDAAPFHKLEFHYADTDTSIDTDILARILADASDTRDFPKLFLWQAERHADILATILARMSVSASWNASYTVRTGVEDVVVVAVVQVKSSQVKFIDNFAAKVAE